MKSLSLAAPQVVILKTSGAASDENFIQMTFPFQWSNELCQAVMQGQKLTLIPRSDFLLLLSKSWSKIDRHRSYFLSLKADILLDWVAKLCS